MAATQHKKFFNQQQTKINKYSVVTHSSLFLLRDTLNSLQLLQLGMEIQLFLIDLSQSQQNDGQGETSGRHVEISLIPEHAHLLLPQYLYRRLSSGFRLVLVELREALEGQQSTDTGNHKEISLHLDDRLDHDGSHGEQCRGQWDQQDECGNELESQDEEDKLPADNGHFCCVVV